MSTKIVIMVLICATLKSAWAACTIGSPLEQPVAYNQDAIALLLSSQQNCPKDAIDFRKQIRAANLKMKTTMVANRGYHNPSLGSFSFFEMVTGTFNSLPIQKGDFFFGHFTTVDDNNKLSAYNYFETKNSSFDPIGFLS